MQLSAIKLNVQHELTYRRAVILDLITLNRISVLSKKHWGYPQEWIEQWKDELTVTPEQVHHFNVWVARLGKTMVGFCAISEKADSYDIEHHWILPEYIGKGYGRKLLSKAIKEVILQPKPLLVVSDPHAEGFYKKMGFEYSHSVESYPENRLLPVLKKEPDFQR